MRAGAATQVFVQRAASDSQFDKIRKNNQGTETQSQTEDSGDDARCSALCLTLFLCTPQGVSPNLGYASVASPPRVSAKARPIHAAVSSHSAGTPGLKKPKCSMRFTPTSAGATWRRSTAAAQ